MSKDNRGTPSSEAAQWARLAELGRRALLGHDEMPRGKAHALGSEIARAHALQEMMRNELLSINGPPVSPPPTFDERWVGAPQQPRFLEDEFGRFAPPPGSYIR